MQTLFKKIFSPPIFEKEAKTYQAYLLNMILWVVAASPIPYLIYVETAAPQLATRAWIQAGVSEILNVLLFILMRRGLVRTACVLQVITFWLFFTATAFTASGVQDEAYLLGYPIVILIAGLLIGSRMAMGITGLSLLSGLIMVYAEAQGWIHKPVTNPGLFTWIISLAIFPILATLQYLTSQTMKNAIERAQRSEEKYRLISSVSSDYTFESIVNKEGKAQTVWMGGAFERMTGYTAKEYMENGGWYTHIHPDDLEKDREDMQKLLKNQDVVNSEIRTFTKSGKIRWERIFAHPVWDAKENRLVGIIGAVQDITGQKLTEEREARHSLMLEKVIQLGKQVTEVSDLQVTLEKVWRGVRYGLGFDRTATFLYNAEREAMDGTIGTNDMGEMIDEWNISISLKGDNNFVDVLAHPNGIYQSHNYDVENGTSPENEMFGVKDFVAVAAWTGGKPVAIICADMKTSQRPITNEQLEALRLFAGYVGLAVENARLHSALQNELTQRQSFIDQLEAKNSELERFTYTVSHDLKSPLVTITGFLGYLESAARTGKFDNFNRDVERIRQAVDKMQMLLKDLLELSRIGRITNDSIEMHFGEVVHEALALLEGSIRARNVEIKFNDEGYMIYGDRVRLLEVIQNLIDNAIKFMGDQLHPQIWIGASKDATDDPVFFVKDNGIGIDPQYNERIFGLFNKLNSNSQGSGIGLTIVKRIIEVHSGKIWVESQPSKGTAIYFTLPRRPQDS